MEGDDGGERALQTTPKRDDVALLIGIRREERDALREFACRFRPLLLDQAYRLGVDRSERDTVVAAFLNDILLKLARMRAPRSLATFVVTAFRNQTVDARRADMTRARHHAAECEMIGGEQVVRATCSEFALRAALGADRDLASITMPAVALVNALMHGCTQEERNLLVWSSHRVPMREIAQWLGISYVAAKQRLARLRTHLAHESIRHLPNLDPAERAAITRLLRRAGVKIDDSDTTDSDTTGGAAA